MLPPKPTLEEINEARLLIYSHIQNQDIRNALYHELNNMEDSLCSKE